MGNIKIIVLFLGLVMCALLVVSAINSRQTRRKLINQRLYLLKRKVADLEELAVNLESLLGNTNVSKLIMDEVVDTLQGMLQLSPGSQTLELSLNTALEHSEEIASASYHCGLARMQESDAQIAKAHFHLNEAGMIIRKRQQKGQIELAEMNAHIEALAWAHLMVTVITLVGQGHRSIRNGDVLRGYAFYQKAQEAALNTSLSDDRRQQFIRELGEITSNKRKSISLELMPESHLNPEASPESSKTSPTTDEA